jgi:hypothetical protein
MKLRACVIALIAMAALSNSPRALATESLSPDGPWWNNLSESERLAAVQGTMDGYQSAYLENGSSHPLSGHAMFSHTYGFYIAAITDFYVNRPSGSRATIGLVLACLADKPVVSCKETARRAAQSEL